MGARPPVGAPRRSGGGDAVLGMGAWAALLSWRDVFSPSGESPGNYLLNANFAKASVEGWSGFLKVAVFAFHPCLLCFRSDQVAGVRIFRLFLLKSTGSLTWTLTLWQGSGQAAAGGELAELAEEWELGEHCSGGGRQSSLRASDYRG